MAQTPNKTAPTPVPVSEFLAAQSAARRADCAVLDAMMERLVGAPAVMWGPSIVGYGSQHYRYESGREGDMPIAGYSPRKASFVVYLVAGFERWRDLLDRLGPHTHGVSCLYVKRLADIDVSVLEALVARSVAQSRGRSEGC